MTRRVMVLGVCLAAAFALSAVVSAVSSATMLLPVFTGTATTGTGASGAGKLTVEGGASINCTSSSDSLSFTAGKRNEGTGTLTFSGCTEGGEECVSLGGKAGTITVSGSWHLVLMLKSKVDGHYFLFVLPTAKLHVECAKAAVKLLLIEGSVLGSIAQKSGSKTEFTLTVNDGSEHKGPQEFTEYETEAEKIEKAALNTSQEGSSKTKPSFEFSENNVLKFASTTEIEK